MKSLAALRARVAARMPSCADPVIDLALVDTCIDFAQKSLIVKATMTPFATTAGRREYDLDLGTQQVVARIMRVWCDNTPLDPMDEDNIASPFAFTSAVPGVSTPKGRPRVFTQTAPGVIALYPIPDAAYTINMRCAMQPDPSATQIDEQLADGWTEGIVHGALARLYMHPGDFLNPAMARLHEAKYTEELNTAMLEANQGITRAQLRVTPVRI